MSSYLSPAIFLFVLIIGISSILAFTTTTLTLQLQTLTISYHPHATIPGTNRYQFDLTAVSSYFPVKTYFAGLYPAPSFEVIHCGVLASSLLSNSSSPLEKYFSKCDIYLDSAGPSGTGILVKAYPKSGVFTEGTFVISVGLQPGPLRTALGSLLNSTTPVLAQFEIDVFHGNRMDSVLLDGHRSDKIALNLTMPSFSAMNPMLPEPSFDTQTGQRFMPLRKSFFFNAKLITKLKNSNDNIRYEWDIVKISEVTMGIKSSLSKRASVTNALGITEVVTNYLQDKVQTNQLGSSMLTVSEDASFEFNSVYRISCVAMWVNGTSGSNSTTDVLIGRSNDIYLRTPKKFFPKTLQVDSVFSVSPQVGEMITPFTFNVTAPFVYDDDGFTSADSNLMFAFGYVNAKLASRLTGGSDLVIKSGMSELRNSELAQYLVQVTPFSSNRLHTSYFPPGYSLRDAATFTNTMILANAPLEYRQNPVLFVHDKHYGLHRVFVFSGGMCVCPVPLQTVYPFMEELRNRVSQGTVDSLQIKSLMGMVQKAYDGGDAQYIDLIQRSAFSVFTSLITNIESPITNPHNKTEYAKAVSNVMAAAKILEMWSFNATTYLSTMALDKESEIVNGILRFIKIIRSDARTNSFNGDSTKNQPLGRIDSSLISSVCASLSNIIQINQSIRSKLISSVKLLSASIVDSISPSEEKTLTTDKLTFIVRKDYGTSFNTSEVVMGGDSSSNTGAAVTVPKGVMVVQGQQQNQSISQTDLFGTEYVLYSDNPNSDKSQDNSSQIVSSVLSFRCIDNGGEHFPLSDLSEPISLNFMVEASSLDSVLSKNNGSMENITCRYWNETVLDWRTNGCHVSNYSRKSINGITYYSINMKAHHTTQFAVFVELSQELKSISNYTTEQRTAYYTLWGFQIGVGVIICIASLIMFILLFIFRNEQPIKAKYIAPFIGMICIFMDALLGSVTRSAVMLGYSVSGSDYSAIALNSLTYISSTILGIALGVSVLSFLLQTIRYHLLRNMYSLIQKSEMKFTLLLLKIITSKGVYVVSVIALFLFIFSYMGGMAGARIAQEVVDNSTGLSSKIYTIATSSFIGAILVVSLVLLFTLFIFDLIISFIRYNKMKNQSSSSAAGTLVELKDQSSSTSTAQQQQQKKKDVISVEEAIKTVKNYSSSAHRFFILDDPLMFRSETLVFIFCLFILLSSYVFGIVNLGLFTSNYSTKLSTTVSSFEISLIMEIVRLILTVIYFVLFIFAFGGLSLIFYCKKYRNKASTMNEKDESQELFELLNDELGAKLFENFCTKEFSLENLKCYRELIQLKQSTNLIKDCQPFRDRYLSTSSALEVNIPNPTRRLFYGLFEKPGSVQSDYEEALDTLKNDIILNLSDTFSRFGVSNDYETWQKLKSEKANFTSKIGMSV